MRRVTLVAISLVMAAVVLAGCDGFDMMHPMGGGPQPEYTIHLKTFNGPTHIAEARRWMEQTQQQAGWKDVYLVVGDKQTDLYRGKYIKMEDTKNDLRAAKNWQTQYGVVPYYDARVSPIPGDDVGPSEYNLRKANGVYTVVVAAYTDVPDAGYYGRRNSAVELCKEMRRRGEQAYFYHGTNTSIVTIGLFGANAVESKAVPVGSYDTGSPSLNLSEMPAGAREEKVPVDPRINQIITKHPSLLENGSTVKLTVANVLTRKVETIDKPSYLIAIPGK